MSNTFKEKSQETYTLVRSYIEKKLLLIKLEAIDTGSNVLSKIIAYASFLFLTLFFLLFANIAIAVFIGEAIANMALGFLIVAAFYLLIAILLLIFRKQLIYTPIINAFIKKALKK